MMGGKIKIYIDGADNIGWSIDNDRKHIIDIVNLSDSFEIVDSYKKADIIHNIWWNNILDRISDLINQRKLFFRKKQKIIVTCSNFIDHELEKFDLHAEFDEVKKYADGWICPSKKQMKILDNIGLKTYYLPFTINKNIFKPQNLINKRVICDIYGIDYSQLQDKIVISSFQRDSLGSDLSKPKWQKDPDLLIELVKELPKEKYVLFLAGPRRHYVINQCKKNNIPYYYVGEERFDDDLIDNALPLDIMPSLYHLTDIYLITSKSEGGPKAAIEATATRTFIMSTDVGLSADFIDKKCIFKRKDIFQKDLYNFVNNFDKKSNIIFEIIENNYKTFIEVSDDAKVKQSLFDIYRRVLQN